MADQPMSPLRKEESVTTREEMDFDDNEHEQETGTVSSLGHETPTRPTTSTPSPARKSVTFAQEEAPPAKPPRPMDTQQHNEATLIEAFPSIDAKVVKAVLMASGGKLEPAFNALLGMSDPDFKPEEDVPPPRPPRPAQRAPQNQLEADEMYARQLAEQYNGMPRASNQYNQRESVSRRPNQQPQRHFADDEPERNFFDDDLPEIGRNIQQGFFDTQKRVNSWINNFKKRIDGEESEDDDLYNSSQSGSRQGTNQMQGRQNFGSSQSEQLAGIRKQAQQKRSSTTESTRYDADPHELGDDEFERLELRDDEETPPPRPPRTSSRKTANPDLFKPTPAVPPQSGPVDEVDAAERNTSALGGAETDKGKKWQSLTSVAPHPEEDNDPFSLGDDDDEKGEDLRKEDTDRLKEAARTSVSAGAGGEASKALTEAERSGSQNLEAKELLSGGGGEQQTKV